VLGYGVYARGHRCRLVAADVGTDAAVDGSGVGRVCWSMACTRGCWSVRYCVEHGTPDAGRRAAPGQPQAGQEQEEHRARRSKSKKKQEQGQAQEVCWQGGVSPGCPRSTRNKWPQGHFCWQLERRSRKKDGKGEQVMVEQYRCPAEHCVGCRWRAVSRRGRTKAGRFKADGRSGVAGRGGSKDADARRQAALQESGKPRRGKCAMPTSKQHRGVQASPPYGLPLRRELDRPSSLFTMASRSSTRVKPKKKMIKRRFCSP